MAESELLTRVLQACGQSAPAPMFPAEFAAATSLPRPDVDAAVDRLRTNGYVQIVDWVQGKGQGYALTPAGTAAMAEPMELRRPANVEAAPEAPMLQDRRWQRGEAARLALMEPGPPRFTFVLIYANLAMFAVGLGIALMRGHSFADYLGGAHFGDVLDTLGAVNTYRAVMENEWWRLLSYQFLHIGWMHLGMNMLALYAMGPLLEAVWGSKRFLALYLIAGFVGGAAVVVAGRAAAGASGPISGLMTSVFVWLWLNRDVLPERIWSPMMSRVGMNLLLLVLISTMPNVSWEGHLGGAIGGILVSSALQYQRFGVAWQRLLAWLAIVAIPPVAMATAYFVQQPKFRARINEQLLAHFQKSIPFVDQRLLDQHKRFIAPLLRTDGQPGRLKPNIVDEFRNACDQGIEMVDTQLQQFEDYVPQQEVARRELLATRRYFEAWRELLQTLRSDLDQPDRLNAEHLEVLRQLRDQILELREPLQENQVLPSFRPLPPQHQLPAPARPANLA